VCALLSERGRAINATPCGSILPARDYKRNPPLLHFIRAEVPLSAPVSSRLLPCSSLVAATMDSVTHRLSTSLCRSRSFAELHSCSPARISSTFSTGELLPRHRPTSSVHSRVHSLVRQLHRGPWTTLVFTFLPTVQLMAVPACATPCALCAVAVQERALHTVWAATWAVHAPRCRWAPQATGTVRVGWPREFQSSTVF
jgi:hypothetical protein